MMMWRSDAEAETLRRAVGRARCEAANGPDAFGKVGRDGIGLAIFDGMAPAGLAHDLDALPGGAFPHFRLEGPIYSIEAWLEQLASTPRLASPLNWVLGDAARQVRRFADATGWSVAAMKLERVKDNACRKLHHDYVAMRLVCTYRSPGTQWLPRACEAALGDERVCVPTRWLRPVPRFAAALFAGRLQVGAEPVLHRSPPIAGTGATRLVLTINEPASGWH